MSIFTLDGSDTVFWNDFSGTTFWATPHFDGLDSISWNESDSSFRPPVVLNYTESIGFRDDIGTPSSGLGGVRYAGVDTIGWVETSIFKPLGFHGTDNIQFIDTGVGPFPLTFPIKYTFRDTLVWTETPNDGIFFPVQDWVSFGVRNVSITETINFDEIPVLTVAGYQVAMTDTFGLLEFYTVTLVPGPNNKHIADSFGLIDSGTLNVAKGTTDTLTFLDFGCICLVSTRTNEDSFGLTDRGTLWINGHRITPPGTLPGGSGSTFRAIIRWSRVENIQFVDEGFRVDEFGIPIVDPSCCDPDSGSSGGTWAGLPGWGGLESWGGLEE